MTVVVQSIFFFPIIHVLSIKINGQAFDAIQEHFRGHHSAEINDGRASAALRLTNTPEESQNIRNSPLAQKYEKGGVSLCDADVKKAFENTGQKIKGCKIAKNCDGSYSSQLPQASVPYLKNGVVEWSQEHSDVLLHLAKTGVDISPTDYPYAVPDFFEALDVAPLPTDGNVLVAGSVSPWLEATLAAKGAKHIFTMDYDARTIETNITQIVLRKDMEGKQHMYKAIASFSSIEHDGLGRYCDPINPDGDLAAMLEFHQWLEPGGILYLGIPVGESTMVQNNNHRIYGKDRFDAMTKGFKLLGAVNTHWGSWQNSWKFISEKNTFQRRRKTTSGGHNWQNQPWFVLQKS